MQRVANDQRGNHNAQSYVENLKTKCLRLLIACLLVVVSLVNAYLWFVSWLLFAHLLVRCVSSQLVC